MEKVPNGQRFGLWRGSHHKIQQHLGFKLSPLWGNNEPDGLTWCVSASADNWGITSRFRFLLVRIDDTVAPQQWASAGVTHFRLTLICVCSSGSLAVLFSLPYFPLCVHQTLQTLQVMVLSYRKAALDRAREREWRSNLIQAKSCSQVCPSKDPMSRLNPHLIFVIVLLRQIERCFPNKLCWTKTFRCRHKWTGDWSYSLCLSGHNSKSTFFLFMMFFN